MCYNLPDCQIKGLQQLQNAAAQLILVKNRFDSAKQCLMTLHWLPVRERIDFKLALLVFKYKLGTFPQHLSDLLKIKTCRQTLRSQYQE